MREQAANLREHPLVRKSTFEMEAELNDSGNDAWFCTLQAARYEGSESQDQAFESLLNTCRLALRLQSRQKSVQLACARSCFGKAFTRMNSFRACGASENAQE
eukprot:5379104-Pleurochrysis_carterae.AAC.2